MSYIGGQDEIGPEFTIEYQEFADKTARREGNWGWGWGDGGGGVERIVRGENPPEFQSSQ